jgi:putative nucleotidyltransferase with HDIG domain
MTLTTMTPTAGTCSTGKAREQWNPDSLPPFPAIALKALNLMAGTDRSLAELCDLIRSDPAFSAAVLRIANSPLVAFSKNVTSVLQASMLLGFRRLKSVVITVGLKAYLKDSSTPLMQACWRHSVACAMIAERSAKWSSLDKDFAYTAGILHDIGRIALTTVMAHSYAHVVVHGADDCQDLLRVEEQLCGIDHCQAGRALVTAWDLPEAFLDITSCHHDPHAYSRGAASLVRPSCMLADALGFSVLQYRSPSSYADTLAEFPEPARNHFPANAKALASQVANEIKVIESV